MFFGLVGVLSSLFSLLLVVVAGGGGEARSSWARLGPLMPSARLVALHPWTGHRDAR